MNEHRVLGAGRALVGDAEIAVGDAIGSSGLQADGVVDRVAGVFQQGYGTAKDAVADAPEVLADLAHRGRQLGGRADAAVRRELGDNGPLIVLAGAVALFGLGLFAFARSRATPAPRSQRSTPAKTATRKPRRTTGTATARRAKTAGA
jgi:uncharacterized protein YjbJ (UPF0337 family)